MYSEQLTGTFWEMQKENSNISGIVLMSMLTTEAVSWKKSYELYWLRISIYITIEPSAEDNMIICTELFLYVRLKFLKNTSEGVWF